MYHEREFITVEILMGKRQFRNKSSGKQLIKDTMKSSHTHKSNKN